MDEKREPVRTEKSSPSPSPSVDQPGDDDSVVDEAGMESFPASDPPSWTPIRTGKPKN